jgi:hypothetical protein
MLWYTAYQADTISSQIYTKQELSKVITGVPTIIGNSDLACIIYCRNIIHTYGSRQNDCSYSSFTQN